MCHKHTPHTRAGKATTRAVCRTRVEQELVTLISRPGHLLKRMEGIFQLRNIAKGLCKAGIQVQGLHPPENSLRLHFKIVNLAQL